MDSETGAAGMNAGARDRPDISSTVQEGDWSREAIASLESNQGNTEPTTEDLSRCWKAVAFEKLGIDPRRVLRRAPSTVAGIQDNGVTKSGLFGRIRDAARKVSDMYRRKGHDRPVIGNPVPVESTHSGADCLPAEGPYIELTPTIGAAGTWLNEDWMIYKANALIPSGSGSTGMQSIPRRRVDFAPPRTSQGTQELASAPIEGVAEER